MSRLQLLPVGDLDRAVVEQAAPLIGRLFGVACDVLPLTLDPQFAYHAERQQYHSTEILNRMSEYQQPECWRLLGVTDFDLYIPILTFVFGEAQMPGMSAVISTHRLRQEFYGLPADANLLRERVVKEAVHELGHTLDLRHCEDYRCAMAASHAVEWIDLKEPGLCPDCRARLSPPRKRTRASWF